jgi:pimeloyl-ACP methyl ester carboxylesterase
MKRLLLFLLLLIVGAVAAIGYFGWREAQGLDPKALEAKYMTEADRFVLVDGLRVRVREEGPDDGPPILLLHGFTFSLETWDGWASQLSSDYRVIRFDLAGHGLTGPDPKKRYSPQERAEFTGAVMDALGLEQAVVGGNSLGGLTAWRFAAAHPERVTALVLVSPAAYPNNGVSDVALSPPPQMQLFLRTAPEAGVRQVAERSFADDAQITERRLETLRDLIRRRGNGEAMIETIEEFTLPDPSADLASVQAATLILWGEEDQLIPIAQGEAMASVIPKARLVRYRDVGHVAQEEIAEQSAADVRAFLEGTAVNDAS